MMKYDVLPVEDYILRMTKVKKFTKQNMIETLNTESGGVGRKFLETEG